MHGRDPISTAREELIEPVGQSVGCRTSSWLNRIKAQFTAVRSFCLDATDHESHEAQAFMIRRYIA